MTWQEFMALLVLATAMSFSPGPNTTLSTALAANGGLPRAMRFVLAVPIGWTVLLALCTAGIGALVVAAPALRWVIKALGIALPHRLHLLRTIHVVIRRWRDIGPVRLDVTEMQAPGLVAGGANEIHRAVRHVGRL